jgi:EAL domain-containing protein (putative c-di-GMP-specific phosphodiesterase class I)
MHPNLTRYEIELDMLDRNRALSDGQAVELLHREFQLALNASHFSAVCAGDIAVAVDSRTLPQEGVARYAVSLELAERTPDLDDEQAAALLLREFRRAINASYFWRMTSDDFSVKVVSRAPVAKSLTLRAT